MPTHMCMGAAVDMKCKSTGGFMWLTRRGLEEKVVAVFTGTCRCVYSYYSHTSKQAFHSEHEKKNRFLQGNCFEKCEYRACSGAKGRVKKLGRQLFEGLWLASFYMQDCRKVLNIVGLCGMVVCGV